MTTLGRLLATSLLTCAALVALAEAEALACSPLLEPEGYVSTLVTKSVVYDDSASSRVCATEDYGCGSRTRYASVKRALWVVPTLGGSRSDGGEDSYVGRTGSGVRYVLKDAAGAVLEESTGTSLGASFARLGATVCIGVRRIDADAGASTDVESEVCAPVTVTSLEVTEQDRVQHAASLAADCDGADGGDTTDDDGTVAASDGCSVHGATRTASSPMLWAVGLVLGAGLLRRRPKS